MIRTTLFAALASLSALGAAHAQTLSAGHIQEAAILGLNPHVFSRAEIAQIDDEFTWRDKRERIRFILQNKARAGEDISHPFTSNEWYGVASGIRGVATYSGR
ncbi:hypothetical protein [Paracoccus aminophilus]|uniref:hypothetical protein n=1 Tax=Paracoccus aminophilus TaxID=34003 RepID=UPI00042587E1|nr:hypothetical protein [Paracoccus aminophilus]